MTIPEDKLSNTIQSIGKNIEIAQQMNVEEENPLYTQLLSVLSDLKDCVKTLSEYFIAPDQQQIEKQKEEQKEKN